jgi:DNA repair protein RecO (recombination protein O)
MPNLIAYTAYLLHTRPYLNNRLIYDFITPEGRVAAIASRPKKPGAHLGIKPFSRLTIWLGGTGELKKLQEVDIDTVHTLQGMALYVGLYVNELMYRLIHAGEDGRRIFVAYEDLLVDGVMKELGLRRFEYVLLGEAGFGFDVRTDGLGEAVLPEVCYGFDKHRGIIPASKGIAGKCLTSLVAGEDLPLGCGTPLKQFMRQRILHVLDGRLLHSWELAAAFRGMQRQHVANVLSKGGV